MSSVSSLRKVQASSHFISLPNGAELHVKRFHDGSDGVPVFMLHGAIENGRIFYSESGKGLGPYLAEQGYDVFIADMQGRGESRPRISKHSRHGMKELMEDEIPAFLRFIHSVKGPRPMHWIAHSWGGVDMLTYWARPAYPVAVASMVFFGSKRRIVERNWTYVWMIGLGWNLVARYAIWRRGYLDALRFKMGSDNITAQTYYDTDRWIRATPWLDPESNFDYAAALRQAELPEVLYLAGENDKILGHPKDVRRLAEETGPAERYRWHVLSRANGHRHDYGHIDMLTHPEAMQDHFPMVLDWMGKRL